METINSFHLIGIAVRTKNDHIDAMKAIPQLWNRFFSEDITNQIPNRLNDDTYCVYTDYEGDHTQPYTAVIGCKVSQIDEVPEGMVAVAIAAGNYKLFVAKGNLMQGVVWKTWKNIWKAPLQRRYQSDFEHYKAAQNPEEASVAIYIGVIDL
jgi:predicted transcriptional regulator YdeE